MKNLLLPFETEERFEKVIVIGSNKIASDVLQFVNAEKQRYGYEVVYIEHEQDGMSVMSMVCKKNNIPYHFLSAKHAITQFLENENRKSLIISAGNYYIFPANIINKKNYTIINFHYALLPKYPGRNAPTWAIFQDEKESGATWHYVTKRIDDGQYIIQKKCNLTEDIKAYELSKIIMNLAYEGLQECFGDILTGKIRMDPENIQNEQRKIYYSYEVPNQGRFNISDNTYFIYKLLRATDYGKSQIFPLMKTRLPDGTEVEILTYKKKKLVMTDNETIHIDEENRTIWLPLKDEFVLKMKYRVINREKRNNQ